MKRSNYSRYFRVFKNDTVVTEVSTNNFQPLKLTPFKKDWLVGNTQNVFCAIAAVNYILPINENLFYGYLDEGKAMEMAKTGAQEHINFLIDKGESGEDALYQYRYNHYQDLTVNLVYAKIEDVKKEENNNHDINDQ